MTRRRGIGALAFMVAACAQSAANRPLQEDFDSKPPEAQKALLPPFPKQSNLIRIYVGPATPFEFFVDSASLSVTQDGVVRYTLIARIPSATNVSYEGIRCATNERKLYALGRSDGTWSLARNPQWIRINRSQVTQYTALADDFFCSPSVRVQTTDGALHALARGNQP